MRKLIALSVLVVVCSLGLVTTSTAQAVTLQLRHKPFSHMTNAGKVHYLKRQIHYDKSIIRFAKNHRALQSVELNHAVRWARISLRIASKNLKKYIYHAPVIAASRGIISGLLCIHSHEGSWSDPGSPYWGGLQMDYNFQAAYGPEFLHRWGTADQWPVWAQLKAGIRGFNARGWSPWYNTAHMCGLI